MNAVSRAGQKPLAPNAKRKMQANPQHETMFFSNRKEISHDIEEKQLQGLLYLRPPPKRTAGKPVPAVCRTFEEQMQAPEARRSNLSFVTCSRRTAFLGLSQDLTTGVWD